MPSVIPDPRRIKSFKTEAAFEKWLASHHDKEPELWLKIHKKDSGLPSITANEALDVCLCYGWIDAIRKSFDESSFLQRYTPRGKKSRWSQVNQQKVARLIELGRMTPHGQKQIDAAKADGRWHAAYAPMRTASHATVPEDLLAALEASPRAKKTFLTLDKTNLFAISFRLGSMKTAAGREKKVASMVETLARGEPIVAPRAAPVSPRARTRPSRP
ncbi:MAG: YdeI/OmpD-associated family protein [Myxococcales bacterium]|nr:YdeI/OmpD-associated family protein [Myxococcales bacterium]